MAEEPKRDPVRSLSNRIFLTISGKWFRAYSIVRHVGRTSGRQYRNPVLAYPLGDGFVIAVLCGTESNWVRNVMAAGGFTLQTKGRDYQLERPEIITPCRPCPPIRPYIAGRCGHATSRTSSGRTGQQRADRRHRPTTPRAGRRRRPRRHSGVRNADKLTRQVRTFTADLAG